MPTVTIQPAERVFSKHEKNLYHSITKRTKARLSFWKKDMFAAGQDLLKMRELELFGVGKYNTFEDYVQQEFQITRQRAYQLIEAQGVKAELPEDLAGSLENVAAANELGKVPKAKREKVMRKATSSGKKATAEAIRKAKLEEASTDQHFDSMGFPVPDRVLDEFRRAEETGKELLKKVSAIKGQLNKALAERDPIYNEITQATISDCEALYSGLRLIVPHAICPICNAHDNRKDCGACKGKGFLSEFRWNSVPKSAKEIRAKAIDKIGTRNDS